MLEPWPAAADALVVRGITIADGGSPTTLRPNRVSIWPVEDQGYGVDFTYHGATGYRDAERAERTLNEHGLTTRFIKELDGAWTVRFGPLVREQMRAVLDHYAF